MDNLTYAYSGNKLTKVTDAITASITNPDAFHFVDGANVANEYTYDANGNITKDLNKNITSITYNSLNLPIVITFGNGNTATYVYDSAGNKLSVAYKSGGTTTKTEYVGNKVYKNGTLGMVLAEEGYITLSGTTPTYYYYLKDHSPLSKEVKRLRLTTPTYYYYLKDHQGNNRVVLNQAGAVQQVNHYYPFGGVFGKGLQTSKQPYKYNGKELDRQWGLDMYDYGARHYDAAISRWGQVDPLAEKYYGISPYVYVANNPGSFIDPRGDTISVYIQGQYYIYGIQNGQAGFLDKNANMYSGNDSFTSSLLSALGTLRQNDRGRRLVDYLAGTSGNVIVRNVRPNTNESNRATPDGKGIIWDPINTSGGIDMNHSNSRPSFIGLGHEMAHVEDVWRGTIDNFAMGEYGYC